MRQSRRIFLQSLTALSAAGLTRASAAETGTGYFTLITKVSALLPRRLV